MWWNKYVGIPFVEKGRDPSGLDCWGLVRLVYKNELGIELPSYTEYYETTNDREILAQTISAEGQKGWGYPESPEPFDVIILNMRGLPMHVGVVTKPGYMLHCSRDINTTHESFKTARWKHKVVGFGRCSR